MPRPVHAILRMLLAFAPAIALLVAHAGAAHAYGQSITAQPVSTQGFLNEPLRVVVRVENMESFDGPTFDPVPELEIKRLPGEQTQTSFTIANGRSSQVRTVAMTFEIVPRQMGVVTVPAFTVTADGQRYSTDPFRINVTASNSSELFKVRVVGEPRDLYIGQQGSLNLELLVKRYTDASLGITLDEQSMWSLVDAQNSSWGVFGPALQKLFSENRRPRGELRALPEGEFLVYTISKPFDPIAVGTPTVGDIRVRMEYPTRLQRDRTFLLSSGLSMAGARTLSVTPGEPEVRVLPLPEGGRPKSWNGAVGDFSMMVVAKPLEVSVGDPITLTMRLQDSSGTAGLDGLQAPLLAQQPAFASGFRVPSEAASGTVEGRSKVFTQSIRALSETVREIPPVEFSFFNPAKGEYETVRSAPIAITVKPSAIARVNAPAGGDADEAAASQDLTVVSGGLVANMSAEEALELGTVTLSGLVVGLAVPMMLGSAPLLLSALRRRSDPRAVRKAMAMQHLENALAVSLQPESVESAMLHFVASRLGASGAGFSRKDALEGLLRAGVDRASVERAEHFLRECERARYVGGAVTREQALEVARTIEAQTAGAVLAAERSAA